MTEKKSLDIQISEDKTLTIYQLGLKDALWVGLQFSKMAANPIVSPLVNLMQLPEEERKEVLEDYTNIFKSETIKENIISFITNISDNYDAIFEILKKFLQDSKVKTKSDSGNKTESFSVDFLSMDDLDLIYEIFISGVKLNYSVGLKKVGKKLGFLE
jgi:hypothetical protein